MLKGNKKKYKKEICYSKVFFFIACLNTGYVRLQIYCRFLVVDVELELISFLTNGLSKQKITQIMNHNYGFSCARNFNCAFVYYVCILR